MIEEKYKQYVEFAIEAVPGIKRTGIRIVELRDRYAKAIMPLENNGNHLNMMYAGSLFCLGEISGGLIHMTSFDVTKLVPIVKEVNIRFKRPALTDISMEVSFTEEEAAKIEAEALEKGKADFTLNLELKDENGEIVSVVSGIWQARKIG